MEGRRPPMPGVQGGRPPAGNTANSVLVAEDEVQQPGHHADDEGALDRRDEAGDMERLVQLVVGDVAGQPQEQPVDDDRDEAEREDVERAPDGLDDRLEYGV